MKKVLQTVRKFSLLVAGFALLSLSSNAADVIVEEGLNTLHDAILANPGSTFILERGGYYGMEIDITIDLPTIIKAADGDETLPPPLIQYLANPGEAVNKTPFLLGASTTFQGIGFQGYTPDGEILTKALITCTAADIEVILDGCVFQSATHPLQFGGKDRNKYILKNNIFFNIHASGQDNSSGYISMSGGVDVDFKAYNNTYFLCGRILNAGGIIGGSSQTMNHNTYVNTWGDTFHYARSREYIATNNIFYNSQIRGFVGERKDAAGEIYWPGDYWSWKLDSIGGDISIYLTPNDTTAGEDPRNVLISNNIKLYDQTVLDFYAETNVSAQTLWNKTGREEYVPTYGWVYKDNYLQEDGNEIDPQFAMGDLPDSSYTNMFNQRRERHLPTTQQSADFPYKLVWLPGGAQLEDFIWPLPFDFKPLNTQIYKLGDDGYPLGDLNWFGDEVVAAWEKGEPNPLTVSVRNSKLNDLNLKSYPNPFSSLTKISYDLPSDGNVTLSIFSVSGAEVAKVVNEYQIRGQHEVVFDGSNLSSGIYFCKIQMGNFSQFGKMSIVK